MNPFWFVIIAIFVWSISGMDVIRYAWLNYRTKRSERILLINGLIIVLLLCYQWIFYYFPCLSIYYLFIAYSIYIPGFFIMASGCKRMKKRFFLCFYILQIVFEFCLWLLFLYFFFPLSSSLRVVFLWCCMCVVHSLVTDPILPPWGIIPHPYLMQ